MYIHRSLEKEILPFLKRKEVLAILGPRQTGKTTLLKHLDNQLRKDGKKVKYLTFENRSDLELFSEIEDFKNLHQKYDVVIMDEFQYAKNGGQKLKYLFDTTKTKYIISGSSSLELTFQTGKYMVGRMFTFTLWPFSFREFLSFRDSDLWELLMKQIPDPLKWNFKAPFGDAINKKLEKYFQEYLIFGGYPAVLIAKAVEEKLKILESILTNYLLKDIRSLLQLASEDQLLVLTKLLANQIGNLINYQELGLNTGIYFKELKKHLEILEKTYIVSRLKPYFRNRRTEVVKNPKIYFVDTGFRNFLISDFRNFEQRQDSGRLVENAAMMSLKRGLSVSEQLNFWRSKSAAELDFVLQKEGGLLPIEVKYSNKSALGKSLHSFLDKFDLEEVYIITKGFSAKEKVKDKIVKYIPAYYL